jgi:hypothetical protein
MRAQCLPLICSYEDETCQGRLEAALLKDAPVSLIRTDDRGRRYFVGDDPRDGYMRLCVSHHRRYDSEGRAVLSDR